MNMSLRNATSPAADAGSANAALPGSDMLAASLVAQATVPGGQLDARALGREIGQFAARDPAFAAQTCSAVEAHLFDTGRLGDAAALNQGYAQGDTLPPTAAAPYGVAGALGRESTVLALMHRAYEAGLAAPQGEFSGTVFRSVLTKYEQGAFDHTKGGPGRYNAASERLIYTAPSPSAAVAEAAVYSEPGVPPLDKRSLVALDFHARPDAQGRHGVADVADGLRNAGLPEEALTHPKGRNPPGWLYQLAGEHPYSLGQQAGKGAADAGASAIRAPSATGEPQINIIPRNTHPGQLQAREVVAYTGHHPGPKRAAGGVAGMPPNDLPVRTGPLQKPAGVRMGPDVKNQAPESANERLPNKARQQATHALEGYPRASSVRYGAAGSAAAAVAQDAWAAVQGAPMNVQQASSHAVQAGALGAAAGKATDLLTPRVGLQAAGGAVAGALEAFTSTASNTDAFRSHQISAAQASANIAVDTATAVGAGVSAAVVGTALGAGASAAVAGATIGSIVPGAGTAVGAVVGFAAGAATYYAVQKTAQISGLMDAAKTRLAGAWTEAEQPLGRALHQAGQALDTGRQALNALKFW